MNPENLNLVVGWAGLLAGLLAGAIIGLNVHHEEWMGGYGSYRRRMARLGHISFFGIGFINILFALTLRAFSEPLAYAGLASLCLVVAVITMPICCFLAAWKQPLRHLFPIPVISVAISLVILLIGWVDI